VTDQSRVALAALLGGLAGGVWGYLFLTARGSRLRRELEPRLDDFIVETRRFRATLAKASEAANEGLDAVTELMRYEPSRDGWPRGVQQTSR